MYTNVLRSLIYSAIIYSKFKHLTVLLAAEGKHYMELYQLQYAGIYTVSY